jgi:FolB domain-containing protein
VDKILIKELSAQCIIGTNPGERVKKQKVTLDLTLFVDLNAAAQTDNIQHTVDYKTLKKKILALVKNSRFFLIETLAEKVARLCLKNRKVKKVTIQLYKPGALRYAKNVGIELTRPS